ncbi:MAG: XRE family transcriptional regulator [Treponema sp.]|jgi:mannose-6-phosphate isomerase-like protein (cupin superfamily)|nr:XRE family transcriptional regulator [Treponema sp.]
MTDEKGEIAARVRALREIEGITAEALSKELGFDLEAYRAWERGEKEFPVGPLVELAGHFGVDLTELVIGAPSRLKTYCLTRSAQGPAVIRRPMYSYWNLAHNFHHKKGEPFLVEANADTEQKPLSLNTHPGQEFDYVLEGRLFISIGGHEMELGPGDSVYYNSNEPHGMKALGGKRARFLAMVL